MTGDEVDEDGAAGGRRIKIQEEGRGGGVHQGRGKGVTKSERMTARKTITLRILARGMMIRERWTRQGKTRGGGGRAQVYEDKVENEEEAGKKEEMKMTYV